MAHVGVFNESARTRGERAMNEASCFHTLKEGGLARVEHHVKAGDFWQTPPNVPHGGRTGSRRAVVLDIFAPPREEYRREGKGLGV
jgi:hypothetical protein